MRLPSKFDKKLCGASEPGLKLTKTSKGIVDQEVLARATTTSCLETTTPPGCSSVITKARGLVTTSGLRIGMIDVRKGAVNLLSPRSKGGFKTLPPKAIS